MQLTHKQIATLPLFLGLSSHNLEEIERSVRFTTKYHKKGSVITNEGDMCTALVFVNTGWLEIDTCSNNRSYHLEELIQAPQMIEPDKITGLSQHYHSTYKAYTACESVSINKEDLMRLLSEQMIVRINFLNAVCRRTQQLERIPWQAASGSLTDRIILFIKQRSLYPAGRKVLHIKMAQLATELNASRLDISYALNELHNAEKIILRRGMVEVPALQLL